MRWLFAPFVRARAQIISVAHVAARKLSSAAASLAHTASWRSWQYRYAVSDEMPDVLEAGTVYLAGTEDNFWVASMLCPCGCREVIELNLLPQARPCWEAFRHANGTVSLDPSIWRKTGCRSHFWLRKGRIIWCR